MKGRRIKKVLTKKEPTVEELERALKSKNKMDFKKSVRSTVDALAQQFSHSTENQTEPLQASTGTNIIIKPSIFLEKFSSVRDLKYWSVDKEENKWEYLAYMIDWLGLKVNSYLEYLIKNQDTILGHYEDKIKKYLNRKNIKIEHFLESLMVSSCFLVFAILLFQNIEKGTEILKVDGGDDDTWSEQFSDLSQKLTNDPIKTKNQMLSLDLQIPWPAVEAIISYSNLRGLLANTLDRLAMSGFSDLYPKENNTKVQGAPSVSFKHLLHIFHWARAPEGKWLVSTQSPQPTSSFRYFHMPTATDLLESATSFKKLDDGISIDVVYSKQLLAGLMEITPFHIFEYSKDLFIHLLRFEQNYLECGMPFTAYMACMIRLLITREDARLLGKNGILRNTTTDQDEVLKFVTDMQKELSKDYGRIPDALFDLSVELNKHHEDKGSRQYASLKNYFCPNWWVFMAFIGSIILFGLTFIQTIYAAKDYYKH